MPADPPPSLLITPDRRRRLQQRYEEAQRLSRTAAAGGSYSPRPNYRRIHDLLSECLRADPGNPLYLDAVLANLRRREAAERAAPWWKRWLLSWRGGDQGVGSLWRKAGIDRGPSDSAKDSRPLSLSAPEDAAKALWRSPSDPEMYRMLAIAAGDCGFDEVELRYLTAARELAPDDAEILRELARTLTRQGQFEEAVGPWFAVAALQPGDVEAEQAISDLRGVEGTTETASHHSPTNLMEDAADVLVRRAHEKRDAGDFLAAERLLAEAQSAAGGDLTLLEMREELRLQRSEHRLAIARRRAASDPHPRAMQLVGRLQEEHDRLAIDLLGARAERLPTEWAVRIELARRLKRIGNFSGAIQRLEEAARLKPGQPTVLIELGECWQHLRQFEMALRYYQQAIGKALLDEPAAPPEETLLLARYRAAVLAAAMDNKELAREQLAAIVHVNPAFKDAQERLDKLGLS